MTLFQRQFRIVQAQRAFVQGFELPDGLADRDPENIKHFPNFLYIENKEVPISYDEDANVISYRVPEA